MAVSLGNAQADADGMFGDVDVGGRPQLFPDAICSRFRRLLGLSGNVAVFPGLSEPAWSRPVLSLSRGVEALSQPHSDRQGYL